MVSPKFHTHVTSIFAFYARHASTNPPHIVAVILKWIPAVVPPLFFANQNNIFRMSFTLI